VAGKTVDRRLSPLEAALCSEWISNDRWVRVLLAEMRQVTAKAHLLEVGSEAG
jgi:hypothetical protein